MNIDAFVVHQKGLGAIEKIENLLAHDQKSVDTLHALILAMLAGNSYPLANYSNGNAFFEGLSLQRKRFHLNNLPTGNCCLQALQGLGRVMYQQTFGHAQEDFQFFLWHPTLSDVRQKRQCSLYLLTGD